MSNNKKRDFSLKKHLLRFSNWTKGRTWSSPSQGYSHLSASPLGTAPSEPRTTDPTSELLSWFCGLMNERTGSGKPVGSRDILVVQDQVKERPKTTIVPKGHLAVYVGRREAECHRVLVPVVYLNHPLFENMLREAEEEFGFSHRGGGITIPCEVSEFERVKNRVAAATNHGRRRTRKKHL